MHQINWKTQAEDDFIKLDRKTQKRIIQKLEIIASQPNRFLDWLPKYAVHKLRVGDYRIFIDLNQKNKLIEVLTIRHRRKAYKRL